MPALPGHPHAPSTSQECESFLRDHASLLDALPSWIVVIVAPGHTASPMAYRRAFDRFVIATSAVPPGWSPTDLRWYLETRRAVEDQQLTALSVSDLARFRGLRSQVAPAVLDSLYARWLADGEALLTRTTATPHSRRASAGRLEVHLLSHRYTQFGDLPGVY